MMYRARFSSDAFSLGRIRFPLLAVILSAGSGSFKEGASGKSTCDLVLSLLKEFRGLGGIDRAHSEELRKAPGLGPAKVVQIKAAFELGKRLCAGRLTAPGFASSTAVAGHFRPLFTGRRQECVCALFLDGQNRLLGEREITEGTPTQSTLYVRRVITASA